MKRLWIMLAVVLIFGFTVLTWVGSRIYQHMPPIPERIVTSDGRVVASDEAIRRGQAVWQTLGGMEVGSIWGHGSYVAPDWTADWLHRECELILEDWARSEQAKPYGDLGPEPQAALRERLRLTLRANRYDPATGTLTIEPVRARAFEANQKHFASVFRDGRPEYAIPPGTVSDPERLRQLSSFFFWTAWASAASRPGDVISYTSNWPHEPLIGNVPTGEAIMWTGVSILLLLGGIGAIVWFYAAMPAPPPLKAAPDRDPLVGLSATPSQRATMKYFVVVAALFLVQIVAGAVVAHYGTEWARKYRWPIYFFIAVGFWNLVGAGIFGFMINPPIALFYMQGLNTTPVHAHAAFFGVYGMLGLGLTLMCLRALQADREWKEGLLRLSFWAMNGGLMAMIVLSLLPVGLLQTVASVEHGYWYARSSEFLGQGLMQTLRWMRMPGDTLFAIGAIGFAVFVFGLHFGYSLEDQGRPMARARRRVDMSTDIEAPRELERVSGRAVGREQIR